MTDGAGVAFALGLAYLLVHFTLYLAVLRNRPFFQTERGIFLYHFASGAIFSLVAIVPCVIEPGDGSFATALALVAAHGVYSISFLELWSLAQGSYSIGILTGAASGANLSRPGLIEAFARIGDAKKADRLAALSRSGLACREGEYWALTPRGACLGTFITGLLWLANIKTAG
jgi:hypothetical protein